MEKMYTVSKNELESFLSAKIIVEDLLNINLINYSQTTVAFKGSFLWLEDIKAKVYSQLGVFRKSTDLYNIPIRASPIEIKEYNRIKAIEAFNLERSILRDEIKNLKDKYNTNLLEGSARLGLIKPLPSQLL